MVSEHPWIIWTLSTVLNTLGKVQFPTNIMIPKQFSLDCSYIIYLFIHHNIHLVALPPRLHIKVKALSNHISENLCSNTI